ncbi:hypothetical protein [Undibacterium sp. TC9W]|uniref:hypothetical protein n=1 Tax=Undibacterium sp. TC9W TaxID=3413053 RepID=UPI003BF30D76
MNHTDKTCKGYRLNGLLEFLLESVPANQLASLMSRLAIDISNVRSFEQSGLGELEFQNVFSQNFWAQISKGENYSSFFLNLHEMKIDQQMLKNPSMQIIYGENAFDVVILLSTKDCRDAGLVLATDFFVWLKDLAHTFGALDYCGGLEPAFDEATQLFSSKGLGPIDHI